MESRAERKEAISKFKERKPNMGAYAIRCAASGQVWVGGSRNLDAAKNAELFALRMGNHRDKTLQADWNLYGEDDFVYEVLEKLEDDLHPMAVADLLKAKRAHWVTQLAARQLL